MHTILVDRDYGVHVLLRHSKYLTKLKENDMKINGTENLSYNVDGVSGNF